MSWQPLVRDRADVEPILREIVAAVEAVPATTVVDHLDRTLLRAYLAQEDVIPDPDDVAGTELATAVDTFAKAPSGPALFGGAAGLGWCLLHVAGDETADQICSSLDGAITRVVADWPGDYDLIGGLAGIGVYALARGDAGAPLVSNIIDQLARRAEPRRGGLAWHTPPERLPPWQREEAPAGYWNLGLAHGSAGVIALLARCVAQGVAVDRARPLLDGAMAFLRSIEPARTDARFPGWLVDDETSDRSSRLAWCYNDLGSALAMLSAATATGDAGWREEALMLARGCAERTFEQGRIDDAGLCHGAFGAAHLFNRLRHATGEACFTRAATTWFECGLAMRSDRPLAGFPRKTDADHWAPDPSLLAGAIGVALAMHAAITSYEPGWDQLLLVDVAP